MFVPFKPLDNYFIDKILIGDHYTKKIYKGFLYPRGNDIREKIESIKTPALYILNTDYFNNPGIHWVLVLYLENKTIFFDPFGFSEYIYNFPFLTEYKNNPVIRNIFKVQNFDSRSIACGYFVLIYSLFLSRGYSLYKINTFFSKNNTILNDNIAINLITWLSQKMKIK